MDVLIHAGTRRSEWLENYIRPSITTVGKIGDRLGAPERFVVERIYFRGLYNLQNYSMYILCESDLLIRSEGMDVMPNWYWLSSAAEPIDQRQYQIGVALAFVVPLSLPPGRVL